MKKVIPPLAYMATKPKQEEVHPYIKGHMDDLQRIEDRGKSWFVKHLKKGGPVKKANPIPEVKGPKRTRDIWNTQTPDYRDWQTDNSKWKKWLADNIAQSQTTIHFDHDRGDWRDKWGDKVKPEDALKQQQEIEKVYNTIYTPEMEAQDKLNAAKAKNTKLKTVTKIPRQNILNKGGKDDLEILVESSKGDPQEMAEWRKLFTEKYKNGDDIEPKYMKFVDRPRKTEKIVQDLLTVEWPEPEPSRTSIQLQNSENELKNLIFKSALNKIEDAASGIGHFNFQKLRLESGGPVDKPPTLEDYLKLGLSLAILTDDERRVVQEMLDKSLGTKK
tara:strand:+ start:1469 stop:2461 length:993 start_codon:yes stop_codon:yes gene_type:complete